MTYYKLHTIFTGHELEGKAKSVILQAVTMTATHGVKALCHNAMIVVFCVIND